MRDMLARVGGSELGTVVTGVTVRKDQQSTLNNLRK